jgi:hypothetical protein
MAVKASRIDNPEFIPFALYQLGGADHFVDVEHVFNRCNGLAPERFAWRVYKYPNYKTLAKALRDFEGKHPSFFLKTNDGLKRQLSAEGIKWILERKERFESILEVPSKNQPTRRTGQRILNEFRDHPLTQSFVVGEPLTLKKFEVADLLLCSPDSSVDVWKERLETYRAAAIASHRTELVAFLDYLVGQQPSWFGE